MNQSVLFNDDLVFNKKYEAWSSTAQISGQVITIYYHSVQLNQLEIIDNCTKFDLEDLVELWLEKNELDGNTIHIQMK